MAKVHVQARLWIADLSATAFSLVPVETVIVKPVVVTPDGLEFQCDTLEEAGELVRILMADEVMAAAKHAPKEGCGVDADTLAIGEQYSLKRSGLPPGHLVESLAPARAGLEPASLPSVHVVSAEFSEPDSRD